MKFKVGDKVKVIAKKHGHGFNIGEIVKIEEISDRDYKCSSLEKNELWWMAEDEFTKVKFIKSDLKDGDIVTYRGFERCRWRGKERHSQSRKTSQIRNSI